MILQAALPIVYTLLLIRRRCLEASLGSGLTRPIIDFMGLIIHPSSCCDVCLEIFTYDEPKPPHAIPCGHIFCKEYVLFIVQCFHDYNLRSVKLLAYSKPQDMPTLPESIYTRTLQKAYYR